MSHNLFLSFLISFFISSHSFLTFPLKIYISFRNSSTLSISNLTSLFSLLLITSFPPQKHSFSLSFCILHLSLTKFNFFYLSSYSLSFLCILSFFVAFVIPHDVITSNLRPYLSLVLFTFLSLFLSYFHFHCFYCT